MATRLTAATRPSGAYCRKVLKVDGSLRQAGGVLSHRKAADSSAYKKLYQHVALLPDRDRNASSTRSSACSCEQTAMQRHKKPHRQKSRTSRANMVVAISSVSSLVELKRLVNEHDDSLCHVAVNAILSKLVAFSLDDPTSWFRQGREVAAPTLPAVPLPDRVQPLKQAQREDESAHSRNAWQMNQAFQDGSDWEGSPDTGFDSDMTDTYDSDLSDGYDTDDTFDEDLAEEYSQFSSASIRRRRAASLAATASTSSDSSSDSVSAPELSKHGKRDRNKVQSVAAKQLGLQLESVARMACRRPMPGWSLSTAASTLSCLALLGYKNEEDLTLLLGSTKPLLDALNVDFSAPGGQAQQRRTEDDRSSLGSSQAEQGAVAGSQGRRQRREARNSAHQQRQQQQYEQQQQEVRDSACAALDIARACVSMKVPLPAPWLATFEEVLGRVLSLLHPSELCIVAHTLGSVGHQPSARWLDMLYAVSVLTLLPAEDSEVSKCQVLLTVRPVEVLAFIKGLAKMQRLPDEAWASRLCSATLTVLPQYKGSDLTRMLTAMSALGIKPEDAWMESFYLAAVGQLQIQQRQVGVLAEDEDGLSVEQLTEIVSSLARLGCRPDSAWLNECLMRSRRGLTTAAASHLARLINGLSLLRFRAPDAWLQPFLAAALARLPFATPQECCSMVGALARLGCPPQGLWLQELAWRVRGRLGLFSCQQLVDLAASMAKLGFRPCNEWMVEWERCSGSKLEEGSSGSLAAAAWALAEMGHRPQVSWLYSFVLAAYGRLDSLDAVQLGIVFEALPRISPYGTWLDELVQICAVEASPLALRSRPEREAASATAEEGAPEPALGQPGLWRQSGASLVLQHQGDVATVQEVGQEEEAAKVEVSWREEVEQRPLQPLAADPPATSQPVSGGRNGLVAPVRPRDMEREASSPGVPWRDMPSPGAFFFGSPDSDQVDVAHPLQPARPGGGRKGGDRRPDAAPILGYNQQGIVVYGAG